MNTVSLNLFEATGNDQVPAQEFAGHNQIVDSRRNYISLDDKPVSNLKQIKTKQTSKISKRSKPENKAIGINAKNKVSETKKKKSKENEITINENLAQTHAINNGENIDECFDAFIQLALDRINGVNIPDKLFFQ